jgi:hypothetical protein
MRVTRFRHIASGELFYHNPTYRAHVLMVKAAGSYRMHIDDSRVANAFRVADGIPFLLVDSDPVEVCGLETNLGIPFRKVGPGAMFKLRVKIRPEPETAPQRRHFIRLGDTRPWYKRLFSPGRMNAIEVEGGRLYHFKYFDRVTLRTEI